MKSLILISVLKILHLTIYVRIKNKTKNIFQIVKITLLNKMIF